MKSDWLYSVADDEEAPYSQQKQDPGLTTVRIISSLLQDSDLNQRK